MTRHHETPAPARRQWSPRTITGLVLAGLALVFVVENRDVLAIRVLVPVVTMPVWTALAAMLLVGIVIGFLVRRPRR